MHDLTGAHTVRGKQHDPGPLRQPGLQRRRTQPLERFAATPTHRQADQDEPADDGDDA